MKATIKTVGYLPVVDGNFVGCRPVNKGLKTVQENRVKTKIRAKRQQVILNKAYNALHKIAIR